MHAETVPSRREFIATTAFGAIALTATFFQNVNWDRVAARLAAAGATKT